jgi:hypothetical protein
MSEDLISIKFKFHYDVVYALMFDDRNEPDGNKPRTYRKFKSFLNVSSYVKDVLNRQHRRILSNFRSGCLH